MPSNCSWGALQKLTSTRFSLFNLSAIATLGLATLALVRMLTHPYAAAGRLTKCRFAELSCISANDLLSPPCCSMHSLPRCATRSATLGATRSATLFLRTYFYYISFYDIWLMINSPLSAFDLVPPRSRCPPSARPRLRRAGALRSGAGYATPMLNPNQARHR